MQLGASWTRQIARLRAHLRNIERYQSLLKTKLSDTEQRYLEGRLSEERFAIETLNFTSSEMRYDVFLRRRPPCLK